MVTAAAHIEALLKDTPADSPAESGYHRSRRNAVRHGLSGAGTVLPDAIAEAVKARHEAFLRDMAPKSDVGIALVKQMALLSVRMEKAAEQLNASTAQHVRHSLDRFDDGRLDEAARLWATIEDSPAGNLRKLRRMPEGVDLLIQVWEDLRRDLTRESSEPVWTSSHLTRANHLLGLRESEAAESTVGRLSRAFWDGDRDSARVELVALIDLKIQALEDHYETLDFNTIAQDRAEAPIRAQFDPGKEASMARRYEAAARRGFYKAMEEFRQVEAAHAVVLAEKEAEERRKEDAKPRPSLAARLGLDPFGMHKRWPGLVPPPPPIEAPPTPVSPPEPAAETETARPNPSEVPPRPSK